MPPAGPGDRCPGERLIPGNPASSAVSSARSKSDGRKEMKRILSTIVIVSFLALTVIPAAAPFLDGSAAYAEVSDKQIKDEISKIKKMIADLEKQLATPRKMSATAWTRP
jgi:hypothetical protein